MDPDFGKTFLGFGKKHAHLRTLNFIPNDCFSFINKLKRKKGEGINCLGLSWFFDVDKKNIFRLHSGLLDFFGSL